MGNSDSRAELRGVAQILIEDGIPEDSSLWEHLWLRPSSTEEVFDLIDQDDMRKLLETAPERVYLMLRKSISELRRPLTNPEHSTFSGDTASRVINAARLITRILPPVLEQSEKSHDILWKPGSFDTNFSMASALLDAIGELLFYPGIAIPNQDNFNPSSLAKCADGGKPSARALQHSVLWEIGVGTLREEGGDMIHNRTAPEFYGNRIVLLRLLLVVQTELLYMTSSMCQPAQNTWLQHVCIEAEGRRALPYHNELCSSLLNEICSYDPVGWGVPFGATLRPGNERAQLVDTCLHVLVTLLDANDRANVFCKWLNGISSEEELEWVASSFLRLLNNVPDGSLGILPGRSKPFEGYQELLVLFWKLLDVNKTFMAYILERTDVAKVVRPLMHFMWNSRKVASKVGLVHISTFIVLLLSGERSFGVNLNSLIEENLALEKAPQLAHCTYGDLLVIVFHKLIIDGTKQFHALFNCFFTILSNISPYITSFSKLASMYLVEMFEKVATPRYLFAAESHHQYVSLLLDVFNNAIQYQYAGNGELIYTLCVRNKAFKGLLALTFQVPLSVKDHPNQFQPTLEWFNTWNSKLPTNTVARLLDALVPKVERLCEKQKSNKEILEFIRTSTMVGLLPVPHPIVIRKYQPNKYTTIWLTTFTWGVLFLRNQHIPLWESRGIKLFSIVEEP